MSLTIDPAGLLESLSIHGVGVGVKNTKEAVQNFKMSSERILSKFRLDGQVALVTGGGQGIGQALAHALGEAGCNVAIADLELNRAENVAAELELKGIKSCAIQVDVSNKKDVENMIDKVLSTFGDLHIACNNVGIVFRADIEDMSEQEWNRTMGVNLNGMFFSCQVEAKHMLQKGYGKIINTASMSGTIVNRAQNMAAYNISKAGVVHLTKNLACEWASRGIRVNCISPGYIDTPATREPACLELRETWVKDIPMGRMGHVDDVTGAVIYLASPLSDYMTGNNMVIDGGYTCW